MCCRGSEGLASSWVTLSRPPQKRYGLVMTHTSSDDPVLSSLIDPGRRATLGVLPILCRLAALEMDRRTLLTGIAMSGLAPPVAAQAPSREKPVRIGILALRSPGVTSPLIALMQGLRELGYVQGRNLVVEHPDAFGRDDRLPQIAEDMVRSGVDVILVIGPAPLEAARKATKTIPLVMVASSSDPVADGVAASLARPGGNTTGLTYAEPDRFPKQLELLKSAAVHVARLAVLWDFDVAIYRRSWEASLKDAGRRLGLSIEEPVVVRDPHELPAAFVLLKQRHVEAILVASGGFMLQDRAQVASLALRHRIPAIAASSSLRRRDF